LAEFEGDPIRERTMAGLAAARTRGRKGERQDTWPPAGIARSARPDCLHPDRYGDGDDPGEAVRGAGRHDYLEKLCAGELDTEAQKQKLLEAFAEERSRKRLEWQNIQVSMVLWSGFERAAFRYGLRAAEVALPGKRNAFRQ